MKLNQVQLRKMRKVREDLKRILFFESNEARQVMTRESIVSKQLAQHHLAWIDQALLEKNPDRDTLLKNIAQMQRDGKVLQRILSDIGA